MAYNHDLEISVSYYFLCLSTKDKYKSAYKYYIQMILKITIHYNNEYSKKNKNDIFFYYNF